MNQLLNKLNQPYPLEKEFKPVFQKSLGFGLFVFLFSWQFKPVELSEIPSPDIQLIFAGFGIITFITITLTRYVIPILFPRLFNEKIWKVRNEIIVVLLTISTIGLFNLIFGYWGGYLNFSFGDIIRSLAGALSVGIIPVTVTVILNQNRLLKKYLKSAESLNSLIRSEDKLHDGSQNPLILLQSETGKEHLKIRKNDLLFIKSIDNYVEVWWEEGDKYHKDILRSSLKKIEKMLPELPELFSCHRGYLINTDKIKKINGNSRGYLLRLSDIDEGIPVARRSSRQLRELIDLQTTGSASGSPIEN
ncbi:LytTR family transcriptional regulator DNA-binding domain-containing protein [bacterium]|nr:LytTR family transcriptional regulator DNA-binding domain-containing protein [bacterium]